MTSREADRIEALRASVERYNESVVRLIEQHSTLRRDVDKLDAVINGIPGEEKSPGLAAQVKSLTQSRTYLRLALQGAWAVLLLLVGAASRRFLG